LPEQERLAMSEHDQSLSRLRSCIERLQAGEERARDELLECAGLRLVRLTRKMLRGYPAVHRWDDTDDVMQNASLRLWTSLRKVQVESVAHFFRLAALHIRRELIDLARHYYGPEGLGANHASAAAAGGDSTGNRVAFDCSDPTHEPSRVAIWADFHLQVEALPEEEREVFDLLWYQGLGQGEAAELLGVSERTVQRRWQAARVKIYRALDGRLPL
jgi:RNA polymerase sigma factor (sigma-70 family)